jgi:hypothetical protein
MGRYTERSLLISSKIRGGTSPFIKDHSTQRVYVAEMLFVELLRRELTSTALTQSPKTSFLLICSDESFMKLLGAHIRRLLRKIAYFCGLGDKTMEREFWRIACPNTTVFPSTKGTDGRNKLYLRARALLQKHASSVSPTTQEMQDAAEEVATEFLQAFVGDAVINDGGEETRPYSGTRYSALFRGRIH